MSFHEYAERAHDPSRPGPGEVIRGPGEVIRSLCALCSDVGSELMEDEVPHGCFCGANPNEDFRFSRSIPEFIDKAVRQAMKQAAERKG